MIPERYRFPPATVGLFKVAGSKAAFFDSSAVKMESPSSRLNKCWQRPNRAWLEKFMKKGTIFLERRFVMEERGP